MWAVKVDRYPPSWRGPLPRPLKPPIYSDLDTMRLEVREKTHFDRDSSFALDSDTTIPPMRLPRWGPASVFQRAKLMSPLDATTWASKTLSGCTVDGLGGSGNFSDVPVHRLSMSCRSPRTKSLRNHLNWAVWRHSEAALAEFLKVFACHQGKEEYSWLSWVV